MTGAALFSDNPGSEEEGLSVSRKPFTVPAEFPPRKIQPVLPGQKALVTGASKGSGAGIALGLAQAGADVPVGESGAEVLAPIGSELGAA